MKEGLRYVGSDRLVRVLLFFGLVPMFLVMPFQNLLVVFADKVWKVGPEGLGILSASAGAGGLVGAVLVAWRSETKGRLRSMMTSAVAFGCAAVPVRALSLVRAGPAAGAARQHLRQLLRHRQQHRHPDAGPGRGARPGLEPAHDVVLAAAARHSAVVGGGQAVGRAGGGRGRVA